MKKIFLLLFILAVIATIFILGFIQSLGVSDPAKLVPASTVIFASTPDLFRTALRWPNTSLAKISQEPDVKEFLQKPFSTLGSSRDGQDAGSKIFELKPRRIFVALTELLPERTSALLGFQFLGNRKNAGEALELIRRKISHDAVISSRTSASYNGDSVESVVYRDITIYSAIHGHWGFISNHLSTLQEALDRAAGKNRISSLSQSADYLKVIAHLPPNPDLQIFINSQSALEALLAMGARMGNIPDPIQVQQAHKWGSIGISSKLDGENLRDSMAIIILTDFPLPPPLKHVAMKFTHSSTLGYLEMSKVPYGVLGLPLFASRFLAQTHLSFETLNRISGSEAALFFTWPTTNFRPPTLLVAEIQKQAEAINWLHQAGFKKLLPNLKFPKTAFYQTELPQYPILAPTFAFHENLLLAGMTAFDVEETLSQAGSSETLEHSSSFAPALTRYNSQNILFSFLNAKQLFERAYAMLRPVIIFSTALSPDILQVIDTSKLPSTTSISKHLHPIVSTQQLQGNMMVFDSIGPITLDQALLAFFFAKMGMSPSQQ